MWWTKRTKQNRGIFKLFSLGGFGVWCLIDLLLIGLGYLGPADGSVYFSVS